MRRASRHPPSLDVLTSARPARHRGRELQAALARRQARRRRAGFGTLMVLLVGGILLGLLATKARTPVVKHLPTVRQSKPTVALHHLPSWSLHAAPARQRVSVVFRHKLRSGLLFDVNTGEVLWQLHPARVLPIASLTKMMTALVAVAHSKPSDRVRITSQATHFSGSGVGLLPLGKRVPELSLLYGLMLPSGNDAAIALAQHVAGTQGRFIALMNTHAGAMGLQCSHFTTVSGLLDQGNYSCAEDLAVIAHGVLKQRLLGRIVASRSAILPFPIKGGKLYLYNNNPLLIERFPGADGVKTGFTDASGPCLVAADRRGRTWLAVVLLNSYNTISQSERLLDAGFSRLRRR